MHPNCKLIIPGTFICCGEGGNYCSDECLEHNEKLEEHMKAHQEQCPMRYHPNGACECKANAS